jgi:hypothetical protein
MGWTWRASVYPELPATQQERDELAPRYVEMFKERIGELWTYWRGMLMPDPKDTQDGLCDDDLQPDPTPDEDIDGVVLFADVDPTDVDAIEARTEEYRQLFKEKT